MWRNEREDKVEWFVHCSEKQNKRHDGSEEQADMGGLYCHLGLSDIWTQASARAMYESAALPQIVCVDVCVPCYQTKP